MRAEAVSVIMGVWNPDQRMLKRAVDSILAQTFADFRFYICDDGSTNGAFTWLSDYARRDPRVCVLRHSRNRGLAAALNTCLRHCEGKYVARQDADDYSHPERLARQVDFLNRQENLSIVGSSILLCDDRGVWGRKQFPKVPQREDFLFAIPFMHGALMLRRRALADCGGYRVCLRTRRAEDYELLMRLYARGHQGANLQEPLYAYREDKAAQERRKFRFRMDEVLIRAQGFWLLRLYPKAIPYVIKPLLVGLLPSAVLAKLKMRHYHLCEGAMEDS